MKVAHYWCPHSKDYVPHRARKDHHGRYFIQCQSCCFCDRRYVSMSYLEWLGLIVVTKDPKTYAITSVEFT